MHLFVTLLWLVPLLIVAGLYWFVADMKFAQQWSLKRAELGAQDNWRELEAHFESGLKCRRPLLLLFQHYILPGLIEADYALSISNQGEHERALMLAEKAVRKSAGRRAIQLAVLPAKGNVLLRLGRYADAREVVRLGKSLMDNPPPISDSDKAQDQPDPLNGILLLEALIELCVGNLDGAMKVAIEASAAAVSDPARVIISNVLTAKGRFQEALDALVYEPSGFQKFLKPEDLEMMDQDETFRKSVEKTDEATSSVFGPATDLSRAGIFLDTGDAPNLGLALAQTQSKLKSNRAMEHIFVRTRACWHAMQGDGAGVADDLARVRQLTDEKPASRSAKYEYHLAAGRAHFLLGQHETSINELGAATRLALHPMEKHTSNYWLARANQAANQPLAANLFQTVIADGFGTWMEADSRARTAHA